MPSSKPHVKLVAHGAPPSRRPHDSARSRHSVLAHQARQGGGGSAGPIDGRPAGAPSRTRRTFHSQWAATVELVSLLRILQPNPSRSRRTNTLAFAAVEGFHDLDRPNDGLVEGIELFGGDPILLVTSSPDYLALESRQMVRQTEKRVT